MFKRMIGGVIISLYASVALADVVGEARMEGYKEPSSVPSPTPSSPLPTGTDATRMMPFPHRPMMPGNLSNPMPTVPPKSTLLPPNANPAIQYPPMTPRVMPDNMPEPRMNNSSSH